MRLLVIKHIGAYDISHCLATIARTGL